MAMPLQVFSQNTASILPNTMKGDGCFTIFCEHPPLFQNLSQADSFITESRGKMEMKAAAAAKLYFNYWPVQGCKRGLQERYARLS